MPIAFRQIAALHLAERVRRKFILLRKEPVEIGSPDAFLLRQRFAALTKRRTPQQTARRKERHLRIIGDERFIKAFEQIISGNAECAVAAANFFLMLKLDRIAECIACRAADQTAAEAVAQCSLVHDLHFHLDGCEPIRRAGSACIHFDVPHHHAATVYISTFTAANPYGGRMTSLPSI